MALRLRGATSGYIELKAPASAGDNTLTLPVNNGSANQLLKTDGNGNLSWVNDNSGVSLSGSTNNTIATVTGANALAGEANLTFDGDNLIQTINSSGEGIQVITTGDVYPQFTFKSNRGSNNNALGYITTLWDGKEIGFISFNAGNDTTNKDNGSIRFGTSSANNVAERMRIHDDGQITIGNDASGAGGWAGDLIVANTTGATLIIGDTGSGEKLGLLANGQASINSYKSGDPMVFSTTDGSGTAERMRITSAGAVHIANTFSAHSEGDDLIIGGSGWRGMTIYGEGGGGVIQFADDADQRSGQIMYNHANNTMIFRTGGNSDRLLITSNGTLLAGTSNTNSLTAGGMKIQTAAVNGEAYALNLRNPDTNAGSAVSLTFNMDRSTGGIQFEAGKIKCVKEQNWTGTPATVDGCMEFHLINNESTSEKMRITSAGKLLVGRTAPITFSGDATDHNFEQLTNNAYTMAIHANQSEQRGLAIYYTTGNTASPFMGCKIDSAWKYILRGDGDCENANNSYGAISDVALKENIVDANSQWNDIKNIKIRNYNFKSSTGQSTHTQIGVIAQELETVSPKLVKVSEDGMKTVSYSVLYVKAIKALQEAMTKIETLETKVTALEAA